MYAPLFSPRSIQLEVYDSEKRVLFHEDADQQEYSDNENDEENDKRPVSKLHRRDTPHHLKNKRVQQQLSEKAANVILNKLKDMPQPVIDEVSPHEVNPMPLIQDVGLPIVDSSSYTSNGIDLSTHHPGELTSHSMSEARRKNTEKKANDRE